jgi:hypothetical protein
VVAAAQRLHVVDVEVATGVDPAGHDLIDVEMATALDFGDNGGGLAGPAGTDQGALDDSVSFEALVLTFG